jgi:hypothetical protein
MMTFQAELDSGKSRSKTVTSNAREDHKMKTRYRMLYAILGVAHPRTMHSATGSAMKKQKYIIWSFDEQETQAFLDIRYATSPEHAAGEPIRAKHRALHWL